MAHCALDVWSGWVDHSSVSLPLYPAPSSRPNRPAATRILLDEVQGRGAESCAPIESREENCDDKTTFQNRRNGCHRCCDHPWGNLDQVRARTSERQGC